MMCLFNAGVFKIQGCMADVLAYLSYAPLVQLTRKQISIFHTKLLSCVRLPAILAHRVAPHLDAVCVVNQPVENAVGHSRIADLFVPAGYWQLRRENQRADLVTVLADLPEVATLRFGQ